MTVQSTSASEALAPSASCSPDGGSVSRREASHALWRSCRARSCAAAAAAAAAAACRSRSSP
eukprot:3473596-Prymnesium_polylepis.1